jgi:hypothetical protein
MNSFRSQHYLPKILFAFALKLKIIRNFQLKNKTENNSLIEINKADDENNNNSKKAAILVQEFKEKPPLKNMNSSASNPALIDTHLIQNSNNNCMKCHACSKCDEKQKLEQKSKTHKQELECCFDILNHFVFFFILVSMFLTNLAIWIALGI